MQLNMFVFKIKITIARITRKSELIEAFVIINSTALNPPLELLL